MCFFTFGDGTLVSKDVSTFYREASGIADELDAVWLDAHHCAFLNLIAFVEAFNGFNVEGTTGVDGIVVPCDEAVT